MTINIPSRLDHVTDVGSPSGNGSDSTYRIEKLYKELNVANPRILTAGHSPLSVAFTASTIPSRQASANALKILDALGVTQFPKLPVAANCSPRNDSNLLAKGQEDAIFRVRGYSGTYLVYGPEVVEWLRVFESPIDRIERVTRIILPSGEVVIEDTSNGSQFRSCEHLPDAHVLEAVGRLDDFSEREDVPDEKPLLFMGSDNHALIVPPDEYGNGRLVGHKDLITAIYNNREISLQAPGVDDVTLAVRESLTETVADILSVWPSSNHFPNTELEVLNIGTKWREKTSRTTNEKVLELARLLSDLAGKQFAVKI